MKFIHTPLPFSLMILCISSLMTSPTMAVRSGTTDTIQGRAPIATGTLSILAPGGGTLAQNAWISSWLKPSDFTLAPLSPGVVFEDVDGDIPANPALAVGAAGVTWVWSLPGGTPLTMSQLSHPFVDVISGSGMTTMNMTASVPIIATSLSGDPRVGETILTTSYSIVVNMPMIRVNGVNFPLSDGFPRTGFNGAKFQFYLNGINTADNNLFTYNSNQPWASIDATGTVSLTGDTSVPSSANKNVTITITSKSIPTQSYTYTFELQKWFTLGTDTTVSSASNCTSMAGYYVPQARVLSSAVLNVTPARNGANGIFQPEWGNLSAFGWQPAGNLMWTSDGPQNGTNGEFYVVSSTTGTVGKRWNTQATAGIVCTRNL